MQFISGLIGAPVLLVGAVGVIIFLTIIISMMYRVVVPTSMVHIVQSASKRISYGGTPDAKNTYYSWPSWMPVLGVTTTKLPVSVFNEMLSNFPAYDKGRVPFIIDIMAFFRISD